MKINKSIRKSPLGVTLIELTVVIAVILTLISVLFIGAKFYKDAADAAACVINLSSITKSWDAVINIDGAATEATVKAGPFAGTGPTCPASPAGTYTYASPATCSLGGKHAL